MRRSQVGAMYFVHFKNGFFLPTGFEFAYTLLGFAVTLATAGAGRIAIDAMIGRRTPSSSEAPQAIRNAA